MKNPSILGLNQVCYLVFHSEITELSWVHFFLKWGYWHVLIVIWQEDDWYVLDPTWNGLEFRRIDWGYGTDAPLKVYLAKGYSVLRLHKRNFNKLSKFYLFNCINCVSLVKYMIGLKCKSITPFSLMNYLIKGGYGKLLTGDKYG